jgi:uncharacterized membrane protein YgaE (UPF0421/DUF939 family)
MSPSPLRFVDVQLSIRVALAAGLSVVAAQWLSLPYPIYAMISAVLVTDLEAAESRKLALPRLAATVLGTLLGATINSVLPVGVWTVAFGVLGAMLLSDLLRLRHAAKVAGYICGVVLIDHGDQPWFYAFMRMAETCVGIGVALLVSLLPKLLPLDRSG